jgi:CBS domain-containing protein
MTTATTPHVPDTATKTIEAWMSHPVITVSLNAPLSEAVALMHEHHVRRLPVVNVQGKLTGIITAGDARGADIMRTTGADLLAIASMLRRAKVREVMTMRPLIVTTLTSLEEAARLMRDYKVGGLPVVDDEERVVGMITESDLFSAFISLIEETKATSLTSA